MGLDITAYQNATPVTDPDEVQYVMGHPDAPSEGAYEKGYRIPYKNRGFTARFAGLEELPYNVEEGIGFGAGSYSGYGKWRKELAELVGVLDLEYFWARLDQMERANEPEPVDMPFWQLLHFSDCEGAIGPEACKALAKDFAAWEERAEEYARKKHDAEWEGMDNPPKFDAEFGHSEGRYFWKKYKQWKRAFEQGSTGWVAFH
jgi:hypothetical protein